jgi:MOSC domain-containing protein YiiM
VPNLRQVYLIHEELLGRMSKAGVMAIVVRGGEVNAGDAIEVELPPGERHPLKPV